MKSCLVSALSLLLATAAHGAEFTNSSECVAGKRVTDRSGKSGVVKELTNGMCVVRKDDGTSRSYLHWMLSPEGSSRSAPADGLAAGNYVCSATGAGSFPITIRAGGRYSDRAGKSGEFALRNNKQIVFTSGSLAGQYSELLRAGKFGLSSAKGKTFYTVCNLK